VQTETIVFFLGNEIKFCSAVHIFGSRSMIALTITEHMAEISQRKEKPGAPVLHGMCAVL